MSTNLNVSESTVYYGQGAYDGMRFVKYVGLADGLGNINQSQLGYIDPDYNNEKTGDFVSSILVFLDNTNAYILMQGNIPQERGIWTLSGSALPNTDIYISQIPQNYKSTGQDMVDLKECRVINPSTQKPYSVKSASNGTYKFDGLKNLQKGTITVWYITNTYYAQTANLTLKIDLAINNIDLKGYFIAKTRNTEQITCPDCSIEYTCSICQGVGLVDNTPCPKCEGTGKIIAGSGLNLSDTNHLKGCRTCRRIGIPPLTENGKYYYNINGDAPTETIDNESSNQHTVQISVITPDYYCPDCQGKGFKISDTLIDCPACSEQTFPEINDTSLCPECSKTNLENGWCPACGYVAPHCAICNNTKTISALKLCETCNGTGLPKESPTAEQIESLANRPPIGSLFTTQQSWVDEEDSDTDSNITERRYNFTWDKGTQVGNVEQRIVIWTYSDNQEDILTINKGTLIYGTGSRDYGFGWCDICSNTLNKCTCQRCPYCGELVSECTCTKCATCGNPQQGCTCVSDCLAAETLITMADGSKKQIKDITCGDFVLSESGKPNEVYFLGRHLESSPHTYYYFDDGTVIHEVSKHRFFNKTQGFFQLLKNWKIGDLAQKQDGSTTALVSKQIFNEPMEMFAIYTTLGTYYAEGLLSGQAFCNRKFLADMTVSQAVDMMLSIEDEKLLFNLFEEKGALV